MAFQWEGREVVFVEFSMLEGDTVLDAFAKSRQHGFRACLFRSARYADTGETVFRSVEELEQMPFRLVQRVTRLASEAATVNGLTRDDDGDDNERVRATNGNGESVGPSL